MSTEPSGFIAITEQDRPGRLVRAPRGHREAGCTCRVVGRSSHHGPLISSESVTWQSWSWRDGDCPIHGRGR